MIFSESKVKSRFIGLALVLVGFTSLSFPVEAETSGITVQVEQLVPGQSVIGKAEAIVRAKAIAAMKKDERQKYLLEHQLEVVSGPGRALHLVDGHHLAWALLELKRRGVMDASAPAAILGDYSGLTVAEFEKEMIRRKWVWLFDENDQPIQFDQLPRRIAGLKDAKHRTLSWFLREEGCYEKSETPFAEFAWASWLRQRISLDTNKPADIARALLEAKALAHDKNASGLPGYMGSHHQDPHDSLSKKTRRRLEYLQ